MHQSFLPLASPFPLTQEKIKQIIIKVLINMVQFNAILQMTTVCVESFKKLSIASNSKSRTYWLTY